MENLALNPLPLEDPKGGALSLTRTSGIAAAIVVVLTTVNDSWDAIFEATAPAWAKPVFLMVVVGAWAVIASADLLGRGYVKAHKAVAEAEKETAKGGIRVIPMPGLNAVDTRVVDHDCLVTAARIDPATPDEPTFLVTSAYDGSTRWAASSELKFR